MPSPLVLTPAGPALVAASASAGDAARGSALASWTPLWVLLGAFALLLSLLVARGMRHGGPLLGVPGRLEARTGVPGWAATTLLVSLWGLVVAGYGFYTDVAWHVALGRDDDLFTAPHTAILLGLGLIAAGPLAGAVAARGARRAGRRPWSGHSRLPWSLLPLAVLGAAALLGFPVDEAWHQAFGVDVTMWSPPHLIMILAASLTGLAGWLVLADAGVRPTDGPWPRGLHVATAALTLQGLSSVQGEFSFGVPQWQHLYHPVLVCLAGGFALVLVRAVHGRGWALGIAAGVFLFQVGDGLGGSGPVDTRAGATYLGMALAVELAAAAVGTSRLLRFGLVAGAGTATLGLAVEWAWNQGAHQPWRSALLPEAVLVGGLAAVSAAVLAAALVPALTGGGRRLPALVAALALAGVVASLALPAPRRTGDVTATVTLRWVGAEAAVVDVELDPPDAARDARWFTAGSWQYGGRTVRHMQETAPGRYSSVDPIPLGGNAKALLRLHRGAELMAVALRLPQDPEYGLAAVPPVDRQAPFVSEQQYLQREATRAAGGLAVLVHGLVLVLAAAWVGSIALAASCVVRGRRGPGAAPATDPAAGSPPARPAPAAPAPPA